MDEKDKFNEKELSNLSHQKLIDIILKMHHGFSKYKFPFFEHKFPEFLSGEFESYHQKFLEQFYREKEMAIILSEHLRIPYIDLSEKELSPELLNIIPHDIREKYKILPIMKRENSLWIAISNPLDLEAIDKISGLTGFEIKPFIAEESAIEEVLGKFKYPEEANKDNMKQEKLLEEKVECHKPQHNILYRKAKLIANIVKASFMSTFSGKDIYINKETGNILSYEESKFNE